MRNEELLDAIGGIRDEWVEDARESRIRRPRLSLLAAVLVIGLTLSVGAFALADADGFYDLLYNFSPSMAQALKPVQLSCVDNGIELTLISADVDHDTARVFIGLRDLEGERVDATCDLHDSYYIDLPGDCLVGHVSFSAFDEQTKTALFVAEVSRGDGKAIKGKKLTFSLRNFLSGKRDVRQQLPLDWSLAKENPPTTKDIILRGWGGRDDAYDTDVVMVPGTPLLEPVEGVTITAVGFVDGMLRVQAHYDRIHETDNHGFLTLVDEQGHEKHSAYQISFWDEEHTGSYEDYLFEAAPEELSQYKLWGEFFTADQIHIGDWQITFPME